MHWPPAAPSWFDPSAFELEHLDKPQELERLWRGFTTARVALGLVLLALQCTLYVVGGTSSARLLWLCGAYLAATLTVRLMTKPHKFGKHLESQWIGTIGVDIVTFAALQAAQSGGGGINYTPLFALPVLMASVLGSLLLAMGASAGVTLLLFLYASWMSVQNPLNTTAHFFQAALTGAGCFAISFVASQVATRLANVELRAKHSQLAAQVQKQVNELVIETLTDGVLVLDSSATVRAANPAARLLLGVVEEASASSFFNLASQAGWQKLHYLMQLSFSTNTPQQADVTIHHAGQGPRRARVRTQLTDAKEGGPQGLCVMFLQDQREMEARMRTEKLASMGRMSAAVAHEIRNPLAAIAQANALLDEELANPQHQQLTQIVQKNVKRLERIVEEVLNIARVQRSGSHGQSQILHLNAVVIGICSDWQEQTKTQQRLGLSLPDEDLQARFEAEHLRQILVNLLDNARRYASHQINAIQVTVQRTLPEQGVLSVWSDGQPMDQSVERHLFEPFFSSESRSSGLGLYICRELCEGHGASIAYYRTSRQIRGQSVEGNEFIVTFQTHQPFNDIVASANPPVTA